MWAGANNGSYPLAAAALLQLAGIRLSSKQIRHLVGQIGRARLAERDEAVQQLQAMALPKRRAGSQASDPPKLAVISMDGGRYQRRDNFRGELTRQAGGKHWRETKVGCLLSMDSEVHAGDPAPEFPEWLATSAAVAIDAGASYRQWAEWIWKGNVALVITALIAHQERLGPPPDEADPSDPRQRVDRALTYYRNNQSRMNYPRYRRRGLPLTSSHIESTVKQINRRIKGSEKFWRQDSGDAVLQLRADFLSDTQPLAAFWPRWHSQQTGSNHYQTAA